MMLLVVVALAGGAVSTARALDSLPFIEMPLYIGEQRTALGIYEGALVERERERVESGVYSVVSLRAPSLPPNEYPGVSLARIGRGQTVPRHPTHPSSVVSHIMWTRMNE